MKEAVNKEISCAGPYARIDYRKPFPSNSLQNGSSVHWAVLVLTEGNIQFTPVQVGLRRMSLVFTFIVIGCLRN